MILTKELLKKITIQTIFTDNFKPLLISNEFVFSLVKYNDLQYYIQNPNTLDEVTNIQIIASDNIEINVFGPGAFSFVKFAINGNDISEERL